MNDWFIPIIRMDRCTGCGLCAQHCPTHAVEMAERRPMIARPQDCSYCGTCEDICPAGAIGLEYEIVIIEDKKENI